MKKSSNDMENKSLRKYEIKDAVRAEWRKQ